MIQKIRFDLATVPATPGNSNAWKVWLGNTSLTSLTAGPTNYVPTSAMTLSFQGTVNLATPGWVEITLTTPFNYTGGNLIIAAAETSPGYSSAYFRYSATPDTRAVYLYSDTEIPNPDALPGPYGGSSSSTGNRANLQLVMQPAGNCTTPPVAGTAAASPSSNLCSGTMISLSLSGNSYGNGQTYQWQESAISGGPFTDIGASSSMFNLNIPATTTKYYRAAVTCSGQTSYSTEVLVQVNPAFPAGSYTINSTLPTGGNNFASFNDFKNAIGCSIAGPVVVDVAPGSGPYNEQVIFPVVNNTSAINTITINGNGATLTYAATASAAPSTLELNGTDYLRINNLNVVATGATYGFAAHLWNGADNNEFTNCSFTAPVTGTSTTLAPFSISGSATSATGTGNSGSNNKVSGCTITGGYYGLTFHGSVANTGNQALNNTVKEFYLYGIYNVYCQGTLIKGNTVERPTRPSVSTGYGIYLSTNSAGCTVDANIVRNLFGGATGSSSTAYCLYNSGSGTAGNEINWTNNLVHTINNGTGTIYGFYAAGYDHVNVFHNTIVLDDAAATSGTTYGIYAYGNPMLIKNNVVYVARGGTGSKYCLYESTSPATSDHNVFYLNAPAGTNNIAYRSTAYATLAAWQAATGQDLNSFEANPGFASPSTGDFKPTNLALDNKGEAVGVGHDLLGVARPSALPDIGAYEFGTMPAACSGMPDPGNTISSTANACLTVPFQLSFQNAPSETGLAIQWESADDAAFTVNVVLLGTGNTEDVTQTSAKWYRAKVTCVNSGQFAYSTPVQVGMNAPADCYCTPSTTGGTTYYISNFTTTGGLTNINKTSGSSTTGYQDFHATDEMIALPGATIGYSLTCAGGSTYGQAIWIDFNEDGVFEASEQVVSSSSYLSSPLTGTFTIPALAPGGSKRMRVLISFTPNNPSNPCANSGSGE